jgi:hypothetical protein
MRVPGRVIKRASARLWRGVRGGRLARVLGRGRAIGRKRADGRKRAIGRGRLGRALAGAWIRVVGRPARAVFSSRLARRARRRLGRAHAVGVVVGAAAAVALGVLSSLAGATDHSRAATVRPAVATRAPSASASPTRFELAAAPVAPTRPVARRRARPSRGGRAYYRRTASLQVSSSAEAGFLPLYREAARAFGVPWQLIASIHRQETAFSTVAGTYHGLNAFGCCAGPMQFNVKTGPVTTWQRYRQSFRLGQRPHQYPHETRTHPSVYDDFDAIMAAGALLRDSGATDLEGPGAWSAAYAYYGHDRFGVTYADQVVARAQDWERDGFCANCSEDPAQVAMLDALYGVDARRQLRLAEQQRKHKKHKHHKTESDPQAGGQAGEKNGGSQPLPPVADPGGGPEATPPPAPDATPTTTTQPPTTTVAPTTTAAPAPPAQKTCTAVTRLLGCRP